MRFCPWPDKIDHIIFFDFDETIRPYKEEARCADKISKLEDLLADLSKNHNVIFGWISGSNMSALLKKSAGYIGLYPHFVGSSLGSELMLSNGSGFGISTEWEDHINRSGFDVSLIDRFVELATQRGYALTKQDEAYQGRFKSSYYLRESATVPQELLVSGLISCNPHGSLSVFATRCNPAAGDPEDAYDVDILPSCASKGRQCEFLANLFSVPKENTVAFGDSANDAEMLGFVAHPYVVANGDLTAIPGKFTVTKGSYCEGIVGALEGLFHSQNLSVTEAFG